MRHWRRLHCRRADGIIILTTRPWRRRWLSRCNKGETCLRDSIRIAVLGRSESGPNPQSYGRIAVMRRPHQIGQFGLTRCCWLRRIRCIDLLLLPRCDRRAWLCSRFLRFRFFAIRRCCRSAICRCNCWIFLLAHSFRSGSGGVAVFSEVQASGCRCRCSRSDFLNSSSNFHFDCWVVRMQVSSRMRCCRKRRC